jgi:hypothetical protein
MDAFLTVHAADLCGKVETFDRLIFKGHLTALFPAGAFTRFLHTQGVLLKDFGPFVEKVTATIKEHAKALAEQAGRPFQYLAGVHTAQRGQSKEDLARAIAARDGITEGLIAVFSTLERCTSFGVRGNRATHKLQVVREPRKCLYLYFYLIDREFGFMHVRLQTWFPFEIQVYVNGREWLARQLDRRGIAYTRYDNTFLHIADLRPVPKLCARFAHRAWPTVLNVFARRVHPLLGTLARAGFGGYYWCIDQAEYATDLMFTSRAALAAVYPDIRRMAVTAFGAADILRFLGRNLHGNFRGNVDIDVRQRPEGWRVKYRMKRNSLKIYDKASVLRIETTINNPREFRVLREVRSGRRRSLRWMPLGKGVAYLWRYAEVGQQANHRYLDALAQAPLHGDAVAELDGVCRSRIIQGQRVAGLNPVTAETGALFQAVLKGEHQINGFRNRDLQHHLYPARPVPHEEARRRTIRISRVIAKLRHHGLVAKVPRSRRYRLTSRGVRIMSAAVFYRTVGFPRALLAA